MVSNSLFSVRPDALRPASVGSSIRVQIAGAALGGFYRSKTLEAETIIVFGQDFLRDEFVPGSDQKTDVPAGCSRTECLPNVDFWFAEPT